MEKVQRIVVTAWSEKGLGMTHLAMTSGLGRQFVFDYFIPETLDEMYERVLQECKEAIRKAQEVMRNRNN